MNVDTINQHESMVSVHWTISLGHITIIRTSCFDTDFASQMKLTKLPLIHCFFLMSIFSCIEQKVKTVKHLFLLSLRCECAPMQKGHPIINQKRNTLKKYLDNFCSLEYFAVLSQDGMNRDICQKRLSCWC